MIRIWKDSIYTKDKFIMSLYNSKIFTIHIISKAVKLYRFFE